MTDLRTHYVYRCFDKTGRLLYIGCTMDVEGRIQQHQDLNYIGNPSSAYLRRHLTSWTSERYASKEAARAAERDAIAAESPLLNVAHNKGRHLRRDYAAAGITEAGDVA